MKGLFDGCGGLEEKKEGGQRSKFWQCFHLRNRGLRQAVRGSDKKKGKAKKKKLGISLNGGQAKDKGRGAERGGEKTTTWLEKGEERGKHSCAVKEAFRRKKLRGGREHRF